MSNKFKNTNPYEPWNGIEKDDPFAPWNDPMKADDPLACWNDKSGIGKFQNECERYF